jgi:hypothetical protein
MTNKENALNSVTKPNWVIISDSLGIVRSNNISADINRVNAAKVNIRAILIIKRATSIYLNV